MGAEKEVKKEVKKETPVKIKKPTFEESLSAIQKELSKRRHKWTLAAIPSVDYDDVSQIILVHIWKKWEQYKPELPLLHWVNRIISNQISNIRRNLYDSCSRPCLKCPCNKGNNLCEIYGEQTNACPVYKIWEGKKKYAFNIRLPVSQENHIHEVSEMPGENYNYEKAEERLHEEMKKVLKIHEWRIYHLLFVKNLTDLQVAKEMGYKSNEGRSPGYATIAKIKKIIIKKAKDIMSKIDL